MLASFARLSSAVDLGKGEELEEHQKARALYCGGDVRFGYRQVPTPSTS